jgi:hypothetical protein
LGKKPGYITRVLNGRRRITLEAVADILWACDMETIDLQVHRLGVVDVRKE